MKNSRFRFLIDENIPYIKGRLEPFAETVYLNQNEFSKQLASDADALLIRTRTRCDKKLLEGSKARLVATATIGTDQIDIPWCLEAGITVRNSPGCNAPGVAQYVWSSLLRLGFDTSCHTLGIIGCGNVGGIVKEWGEKLGVRILVCDPFRPDLHTTDLETLMASCDAVTLHTPLTRSGTHPTFHMISGQLLESLPHDAIFINAARGPVVDFKALKKFLSSRPDVKAVIDTWEGEPVIDPEMLSLVRYATPHIAGYSRQGKERATRMVLEAVADTFGISPDLSGLEGPYRHPTKVSPAIIMDSYDPALDDAPLRNNPQDFENLRENYHYREETLFSDYDD